MVADDATNKMVNELIHNYKIKLNDYKVHYVERNLQLLLVMNYQLEF
jgi:hypothetical protein